MILNINPGGGSGEPELLWTNPSPTSGFASQTLQLPTGYSAYIVEIKAASNSRTYVQVYTPFSEERKKIMLEYYYRYVNSATDGSIVFSTGYYNSGSGSISNTSYAIPTRICGVKWTI